tara:strand:- start:556 stop:1227 length:672 start_codon:yes stop_codon:yes gene_type:complete
MLSEIKSNKMLSVIKSNKMLSSLELNREQKTKLLTILERTKTIIENPVLFRKLLSKINHVLLYIKKNKPQELNKLKGYINMIKKATENRDIVIKELKDDVKNLLDKIELNEILSEMSLNRTSNISQLQARGKRKKKARSKKSGKGNSRSHKRFAKLKKHNTKKLGGGPGALFKHYGRQLPLIEYFFIFMHLWFILYVLANIYLFGLGPLVAIIVIIIGLITDH